MSFFNVFHSSVDASYTRDLEDDDDGRGTKKDDATESIRRLMLKCLKVLLALRKGRKKNYNKYITRSFSSLPCINETWKMLFFPPKNKNMGHKNEMNSIKRMPMRTICLVARIHWSFKTNKWRNLEAKRRCCRKSDVPYQHPRIFSGLFFIFFFSVLIFRMK